MFAFLVNLLGVLGGILFAVGLPFVALLAGESVADYQYPHAGNPFSGVGVFSAMATFGLWTTWTERSLRVNIFIAVIRIVLCYLLVFVPVFCLIKSDAPLAPGIFASLAYYLVGSAALNTWKNRKTRNDTVVERGAGVPVSAINSVTKNRRKPFRGSASASSPPSPSARSTPPGQTSYDEMKRLARMHRPK